MRLIALMAVRNESWVLGLSLRAVLRWCDSVVVLNHASTDDSVGIVIDVAEEHPGRVHLITEDNPVWLEMNQRQRMLEKARELGATHLAYVDADEVLTANLIPLMRPELEAMPPAGFLQLPMPCMWRSLYKYRDDPSPFGRSVTMVAFRDDPSLSWQPRADGYQFHSREPRGVKQFSRGHRSIGGLMHLQFASWRRLVAKHARYKMMERVMYPEKSIAQIDQLYSMAPNEDGVSLVDAPAEWWAGYEDLVKHVDLNQIPWQEAECQRLWNEHGAEYFVGLSLFGVVGQAVAA